MTNLLTPEQKKKNNKEQILRLSVVFLWFLFATAVLASVFLVPAYLLAGSKERNTEEQLLLVDRIIEERRAGDTQQAVTIAQEQLNLLGNVVEQQTLLDILEQLLPTLGTTIRVTDLSYTWQNDGTASLDLTGVASDRSSLLAFTKRLEREPIVLSVSLPVSNFAQSKDISFSIVIRIGELKEE